MIAKFKLKRVYGRPNFYPLDETATILVCYANPEKKCLNVFEMKRLLFLTKLGCTFQAFHENGQDMSIKDLVEILRKKDSIPT